MKQNLPFVAGRRVLILRVREQSEIVVRVTDRWCVRRAKTHAFPLLWQTGNFKSDDSLTNKCNVNLINIRTIIIKLLTCLERNYIVLLPNRIEVMAHSSQLRLGTHSISQCNKTIYHT